MGIAVIAAGVVLAIAYSQIWVTEEDEVAEGLKLFTGERRFANGGPPCINCHSISSLGIRGGVLGPDLSRAFKSGKYVDFSGDEEKLRRYLSNPTTPVMSTVWGRRPLTQEEISSLIKLLVYASEKAG